MKRFTAILFTLVFMTASVAPSFAQNSEEAASRKMTLELKLEDVTVSVTGAGIPEGAVLKTEDLKDEDREALTEEIKKLRKDGEVSSELEIYDLRMVSGEEEVSFDAGLEISFRYKEAIDKDITATVYRSGEKTEAVRTVVKDDTVKAELKDGLAVTAVDFTRKEKEDASEGTAEDKGEETAEGKGKETAEEEGEETPEDSAEKKTADEDNDKDKDKGQKDGQDDVQKDSVKAVPLDEEDEEAEEPSGVKKFLGRLFGSPKGSDATPLPLKADGISIERASVKWRTTDKDTLEMTDVFDDMPFRVDITASGSGMLSAGDIEIELPAYIWKTRKGDIAHELTLGVPSMGAAEESGADFAYRKSGDKVYITNVRRMSAAAKISIDGTYRAKVKASAMNEAEESGDLRAAITLVTPRNRQVMNIVTNSVNAKLDTGVQIDKSVQIIDSRYCDDRLYQTSAPYWATEYEATKDAPDDFYYLEWKVFSAADGTQAYDLFFSDAPADRYGGIVLGIGKGAEGEHGYQAADDSELFTSDYQGTEYVRRRAYTSSVVRVAYPKANFPNGNHVLKNEVTATVVGSDDGEETSKTETYSTVIKTKTPQTHNVRLVWELNEDKYDTPVETIKSRVPETWDVYFYNKQSYIKVSEEGGWTASWSDGGVGRDGYEARERNETGTHGPGGISEATLLEGIIGMYTAPDGTMYRKKWWFDTRARKYDAKTNTWTIYNDYHEGEEPVYPRYSALKRADRTHRQYFTSTYNRNPRHLDINELNRGNETDEIRYTVYNSANVIEYTTDQQNYSDYFDPDRLKKKEVALEIEDSDLELNSQKLKKGDYYISSVTIVPPMAKDFVPETGREGRFTDGYFEPFELYGSVNGKWELIASGDENLVLTAGSIAEIRTQGYTYNYYGVEVNYARRSMYSNALALRSGFVVDIKSMNVTGLKMVLKTRGAEIDTGYEAGVKLLPSEANLDILNASKVESDPDYVYGRLKNTASFDLRTANNDVIRNEKKTDNAYLYGKDIRLGFDLIKSSERFENDLDNRQLRANESIKLDRECTVDSAETISEMYEKGLMPDTWSGTFYDLLPPGAMVDMDTLKLTHGSILNSEVIQNWRGSGRNMLRADVSFREAGTHTVTGDRVSWKDPVLSFDITYPWEEVKNYGLENVRNLAVYVADEPRLGNREGRSGENDEPSGENHSSSKKAIKDSERSLVSNLYGKTGPKAIYAGINIPYGHYDFASLVEPHKYVAAAGDSIWSDGMHGKKVVVPENGSYQYKLVVSSGHKTTTKQIVMLDVLENCEPYRITDAGDNGSVKEGDLISPTEFTEINKELEEQGKEKMQGEKQTGWKGSFKGINVAEIRESGAEPVVYYSTVKDLDVSGYTEDVLTHLANSPDWSVKAPSDLSKVTAVAVDCTKDKNGKDFTLEEEQSLVAYLYMKAPSYDKESDIFDDEDFNDSSKNRSAYNGYYALTATVNSMGQTDEAHFNFFEFTKTDIYAPKMKLIKKWADNDDSDGFRPDSISLELLAGGKKTGKQVELSSSGNWEAELGYMPLYDENGNRLRYSASEGVVERYTQDPSAMSVKDGIITLSITNRHEPEKTDVPFTKTWYAREDDEEGWEEKIPDSLTFRLIDGSKVVKTMKLYKQDAEEGVWSGTFTGVPKYRKGKEIEYTVTEVFDSDEWYSETNAETNAIRNFYYPYGRLEVVKDLVDATDKARTYGKFSFRLSLSSKGSAYEKAVPYSIVDRESGSKIREGSFEGGGEFTLKAGEKLVIEKLATSVDYEIEEAPCAGFTLISSEKTSGRVKPNKTTTASFTNRYKAEGSVELTASKTLSGRELQRNQFRFELRDDRGRIVSAAGNSAGGSISFGELSYTEADDGKTFIYSMSEADLGRAGYTCDRTVYRVYVTPRDSGDGTMNCDTVFKKLTRPGEDELRAQIEEKQEALAQLDPDDPDYDTEKEALETDIRALQDAIEAIEPVEEPVAADKVQFSNSYHASGSIVLKAYKALPNGDLSEYSFRFDLIDQEGREIDTAHNDGEGSVLFEALHFTEKDAGKSFYYVIREHEGTDATVSYDKSLYGYKVEVIDPGRGALGFNQTPFNAEDYFRKDADGKLIVEDGRFVKDPDFEAEEGELPVFRNTLKDGGLSVSKFTTGTVPESEKDREFEFVIRLTGEDIEDKEYDFDLEETVEQEVNVTFRLSDGHFNNDTSCKEITKTYKGTSAGTLFEDISNDTATRPGYAFEGWFEDPEFTKPFDHNEHITEENITLYGKWVDKTALYSDGTLVIAEPSSQRAENIEAHGELIKEYDYAADGYSAEPFKDGNDRERIKHIRFGTLVRPNSLERYFNNLFYVEDLDLSNLDSSGATSMRSMFSGIGKAAGRTGDGWSTATGTLVTGLDGLNTSNVTNMFNMFYTSKLFSFDTKYFDTSNVTSMEGMFRNITETGGVAGESREFALDISSFDTSKVESMRYMFARDGDCNHFSLKGIYASERFVIKESADTDRMFLRATGLPGYDQYITDGRGAEKYFTDKEASTFVPEPKTDGVVKLPSEVQVRLPSGSSGSGTAVPGSAEMKDGEMRVKLRAGHAAVFRDIPAGTAYQVYEITPDGWTLVSPREASGKIIACETQAAEFCNKYEPGKTSVQFNASKLLDGKAPDTAFDFGLYEVTGGEEKQIGTASSAAGGAVSFGQITYDDEGTHEYRIREINKTDSAISYDDHTATVTVKVEADGDKLTKKVTYSGDMIWRNTSKPGSLEIRKDADVVTGANEDDEFTIRAILEDRNGVPLEFTAKYYIVRADGSREGSEERPLTAKTGKDGIFDFKLKAGDKAVIINGPAGNKFRIQEPAMPDGWTLSNIDEAQHHVVAGSTSIATVTNSYSAEGEAVIEARKVLEGRDPAGGEFRFTLSDKDGEILQTATNGAAGTDGSAPVSFTIEGYTEKDIGKTFTYSVKEIKGSDDTVTYDDHEETVTVKISDAGGGALKADVEYDNDGAVFTNSVATGGDLVISNVTKDATEAAADTVFRFRIKLRDAAGNDLRGSFRNEKTVAAKNIGLFGRMANWLRGLGIGNGDTFILKGGEELTISGLPVGTQYEIEELDLDKLGEKGWTLESTSNIRASIIADKKQEARFVNRYSTMGEAVITASKQMLGGELEAGAYSFELVDESGRRAALARNDADGNIKFTVPYDQESDGRTHYYSIREVAGNENGIVYDPAEHRLNVAVADNGEGKLLTRIGKDADISFRNAVERRLTITKTVGGNMGEEDRDFRYTLTFDRDFVPYAEGLSDNGEGEYSFTLRHGESIDIGGIPHGVRYTLTEEDSEYTEHVNGHRGRKVTGAVTEDTTVEYRNDLDTIPQTKVKVRKVWLGTPEKSCKVELHQIDQDGNDKVIKTARLTARGGWEHTFSDIPKLYEERGNGDQPVYREYIYEVSEVPVEGWRAETKFDESSGIWVISNHKIKSPDPDDDPDDEPDNGSGSGSGDSPNGGSGGGSDSGGIGTGDANDLLTMTAAAMAALLGIVLIARKRRVNGK